MKQIIEKLFPNTVRRIKIEFLDSLLTAWFLHKSTEHLIYEYDGKCYEVIVKFKH